MRYGWGWVLAAAEPVQSDLHQTVGQPFTDERAANDATAGPSDIRRCRGTNNHGKQCKRWAIRGSTVCAFHGGRAPMVRAAARRRMLELVGPAFETLLECMADTEARWQDRVQAAIAVLDRAGFGPKATLTIEDERSQELSRLSDETLAARAEELARVLRESGRRLPPIDAEVVGSEEDGANVVRH